MRLFATGLLALLLAVVPAPTSAQAPPPTLEVEVTNDADGDGTFREREAVPADEAPREVTFRAVVTNAGGEDLVISAFLVRFGSESAEVCPGLRSTVLPAGLAVTCQFTVEAFTDRAGEDGRLVFEAQAAPRDDPEEVIDARGASHVAVEEPAARAEPAVLAMEVEKTNDADGDGEFSEREVLLVPADQQSLAGDVDFRVVLRNAGGVPVTIVELTDGFGGEEITVCPQLAGTDLAPGEEAVCAFTIEDYRPAVGSSEVNTVLARVEERERPENALPAQHTSQVDFVQVLEETAGEATVLPATGAGAGTAAAVGLALLALGAILNFGDAHRRSAR